MKAKIPTPEQNQKRKKQIMFDTGVYLLAMSDEGMETKQLKEAIKELENLIYIRENLPF